MIPPSPRSSCALLCLALATSIGLGPLPLHAAPASSSTSTAPADPRSATARDHYSAGRYAEAARLFEAIWRDGGRPNVLYNAGMAREAAGAGHEALALIDWRRYLEADPEITNDELADLERRMIAAAERTASIELLFDRSPGGAAATGVELLRDQTPAEDALVLPWSDPGPLQTRLTPGSWTANVALSDGTVASQTFNVEAAGGSLRVVIAGPLPVPQETPPPPATVTARFAPAAALSRGVEVTWEGSEPPPTTTVHEPELRVELPAGSWVLHASARGFVPLHHELDLRAAEHEELDLKLRRDPVSSARRGLSIGLGAAAFGLVASGAAVAGRSVNERSAAFAELSAGPSRDTRAAYVRTMKPLNQGIGTLSGGLGVGVVAATVAAGGRRTPLLIELGLGGALAIGGVGGLRGVTRSGLQRDMDPAPSATPRSTETAASRRCTASSAPASGWPARPSRRPSPRPCSSAEASAARPEAPTPKRAIVAK
ncbi:MAG: hypothetical protein H6710_08950 [Myxococcales bacterium]|nr:hypothetical protein [Myxococcales bacterium]